VGEQFLRRFHAAHAGITSRVLARADSYQRLAERVPDGARVLDLGCGDGHLVRMLAPRCTAVGLDLSIEELAGVGVQGRAQQLPFADASFDAVVSHLAFMLFDDIELVVREIERVLAPNGTFIAMLGGGPTAGGADIFHRFLELAKPRALGLGDARAKSEAGWRSLFPDRAITFERCAIDLSGTFDETFAFLAASYEVDGVDLGAIRSALATEHAEHRVELTVVMWLATRR
jgi:SAM-dependent methyltransferase